MLSDVFSIGYKKPKLYVLNIDDVGPYFSHYGISSGQSLFIVGTHYLKGGSVMFANGRLL